MEKDMLQVVMMEITLMVMDVVEIVKFKLDTHVMEVHPTQEIFVQVSLQVKYSLKTEDNQDYLEKLFLT